MLPALLLVLTHAPPAERAPLRSLQEPQRIAAPMERPRQPRPQDPERGADSQRPAAGLEPWLSGGFSGVEDGAYGPSTGWCRFESLYDGHWTLQRYQSVLDDQPLYGFVQVLRPAPDGSVQAWHFNDLGDSSAWTGRLLQTGMMLRRFDEAGCLLALQTFTWDALGYEFELWSRTDPGQELARFLHADYRRVARPPDWTLAEAAAQRARELPYGYYLGRFAGLESSAWGESRGSIETVAILDGAWYESRYRSLRGQEVVYAGMGITRCEPDGSTVLSWFDLHGEHQELRGTVGSRGAEASLRNARGETVERHTDVFTAGGYDYRIEVREAGSPAWSTLMEARYRRVPE